MKLTTILLFTITTFRLSTNAQEHKPKYLTQPVDWEFEQFTLPPSFAPAITYKGIEELRFAPGMFKKDSANYYTYVFVAAVDEKISISEKEITHYLINYYRGLSATVAKDRNLSIDTSTISAVVEKKIRGNGKRDLYAATVQTYGVFDDAAPVTLNMDITVISNPNATRTYLFLLASPRLRNDTIWKDLHAIQENAIKNITD